MHSTITYRDREIDLKPYFEGFPYFGFLFADIMDQLYYLHRGEKVTLYRAPLSPLPDLETGEKVSDLDFNLFSAGNFQFDPDNGYAYFSGDEKNDEQFNIYRLDLATGEREKITNEEYIYGFRFLREEQELVFIARKKTAQRMISYLKSMNIATGTIQTLLEDDPDWTFTWSNFIKRPDTGEYIFRVNYNYDRNQSNLISFNPLTKQKKILLPEGVKRTMFSFTDRMPDRDTLIYLSDESGYINVYKLALSTGSITPVTRWDTAPVGSLALFPVSGKDLLFVTRSTPVKTDFFVFDPADSRELYRETIHSNFHVNVNDYLRLFAIETSVDDPFTVWELIPRFDDRQGFQMEKIPFIRYPEDLLDKIVHGKAEAAAFTTFDRDEATGQPREIHAFVFTPNRLPDNPKDRKAIITAFYGGDNMFNKEYQILLQAGFIVMSPSVRGSWGFGADFYSLNDRDLGGNEIIDLIYGARYLCRRFGLEEHQVGLTGGSHGGYCSMRGLTYPDGVNGHHEHFEFGFAIASFGISNIIDYYHTCNIPDWVLQKAGNPETEAEKLNDRSPVNHAGKSTGKLLLVHGENDNRVPVEQSRQMARAMEKAGKPYTYLEIPGQGHGWKGLNENLIYFKAVFDFFNTL